jgi:hypothetical protein
MRRLLVASLALTLLAGCAGIASNNPTASPTKTAPPEPVFVAAPLTGVLYEEGTNPYLTLPAVSAKIDNTDYAYPQLSLNDADVVYVTRVEGGMTRLLVVWHSRMPEDIGPVRSVRPSDPLLFSSYNGVFVYSGGQAPFKKAAKETGLIMSDEDTEYEKGTYFREPSRNAPWNLIFKARALQARSAAEQPAPAAQFEFSDTPTAATLGTVALSFSVKYPGTLSAWEPGTAAFPWSASAEPVWLRSQNGDLLVQQNDERVFAKNIVVIEHTSDLSFIDPRYGPIPKAEIVDNTGVAHIFSNGYYLKAVWTKGAMNQPFKLTTVDGQAVQLAIGNTWIEMMDVPRSKLTVVEPEPVEEETTTETEEENG